MKQVCRYCKHYSPDDRYDGVVGWCKVKGKPSSVESTCSKMAEGKQKWLNGKEVTE